MLLPAHPATARSSKYRWLRDTVYLRSGELLVGEIKDMRVGMLTIDSRDLNLVTVKMSKVSTIDSWSDTMRIETSDKQIWFGALKPSDKPGWVYIVTEAGRHHIDIGNINLLLPYQKSFWDNLSGNVSIGFSYSRSSGIGQLNSSFSVAHTSKRLDITLSGSSMSSIDTTKFSHDRAQYDVEALYNIKGMWYGVLALDYQRNLQLSIQRRFQELVGGGYKIVINRNFQILGLGGLSVSQERSTDGVNQNFLMEVPLGFNLDYYKFSHPNIQISSQHLFYAGLTQWGRVRYDTNTTISWELVRDFSLSVNLYASLDSRPPDPTAGKVDYGTVVGVTYKF